MLTGLVSPNSSYLALQFYKSYGHSREVKYI